MEIESVESVVAALNECGAVYVIVGGVAVCLSSNAPPPVQRISTILPS